MLFDLEFQDLSNGFIITNRNGGARVSVQFFDYHVVLMNNMEITPYNIANAGDESTYNKSTYRYSEYMLIYSRCCNVLIKDSAGNPLKFEKAEKAFEAFVAKSELRGWDYFHLPGIEKWLIKKVGQCMNARFVERWHKYKGMINQEVRAIDKRLNAVLGFRHHLDLKHICETLDNYKYFKQDFFKYNFCPYFLNSMYGRNSTVRHADGKNFNLDTWPTYLSEHSDKHYVKTMMSLPRMIPHHVFMRMVSSADTKLNRVLTKRSEIIFNFHQTYLNHIDSRDACRIAKKASHKEIAKAAKFMRGNGYEYRLNSYSGIIDLFTFLVDYPERYNGDLMGLARRSLEWHNDYNNISFITEYTPNTPLATPPWGEIEYDGISFLSTVGDLQKESAKMHHCVSSYSSRCIQGGSFIYHVRKDREKATVEVNPEGIIVQAQGPCNKQNDAAKWGRTKLKRLINKKVKEKTC